MMELILILDPSEAVTDSAIFFRIFAPLL